MCCSSKKQLLLKPTWSVAIAIFLLSLITKTLQCFLRNKKHQLESIAPPRCVPRVLTNCRNYEPPILTFRQCKQHEHSHHRQDISVDIVIHIGRVKQSRHLCVLFMLRYETPACRLSPIRSLAHHRRQCCILPCATPLPHSCFLNSLLFSIIFFPSSSLVVPSCHHASYTGILCLMKDEDEQTTQN